MATGWTIRDSNSGRDRLWGHPSSYPLGTGVFPGVIRPGPEANHPPRSSIEVKNEWIYTSTPSLCLHGSV